MTVDGAASVLGVPVDASANQIEQAYKRRARETHPDRFVDASDDVAARANADFVRIAEARQVMRAALVGEAPPTFSAESGRTVMVPARPRWALIITWTVVAAAAVFLAVFDASASSGVAEPVLRYTVLVACLVAFAITGRRLYFAIAVVAFVATAVLTILFTTFGNLFGLFVLCAPAIGLVTLGLQVRTPREMYVRNASP